VTHVLGAGVLAAFLTVLGGGFFIAFLRDRSLGQNIREEGPVGHRVKQGTPTMGGLLILTMGAISFLIFTERSAQAFTVLGVTVACAAIGFADDYAKIANKRSLGLAGRWKLAALVPISAVLGYVAHHEGLSTRLYLPLIDQHIDLGYGWYALVFLVLAGSTSAVNLTDGLDGLATGLAGIAAAAFATFAYLFGRTDVTSYLNLFYLPGAGELAVFCAALMGAAIGFLWFNAHPAQVFMGDTGSLAIGGALGTVAILLKAEFLLLLIGGVFAAEAVSVILQTGVYKWFKRSRGREYADSHRVFRMAPLHHHFEKLGWAETTVVTRFYILGLFCALIALSTLKVR
jgi:phospho-N-acetylmuramoyl-pentapeptide-transferase